MRTDIEDLKGSQTSNEMCSRSIKFSPNPTKQEIDEALTAIDKKIKDHRLRVYGPEWDFSIGGT